MKLRLRGSKCILLFSVLSFVALSNLRGDVTGSILGVVKDRTQAVVTGATVVATNVATNLSEQTTSAVDGTYRFLALPAGTYKVTASAASFQQYTASDIDLKVNDQLRIDVTLEVGSVQQEVNVTANAIQVETESTQLGDVIESKKMLALPLNGRSYIDLLGLQAGVAPIHAQARFSRTGQSPAVLRRRQRLRQWPARDRERVSGQRRRRERGPQSGRRLGSQSGLRRGISPHHQQLRCRIRKVQRRGHERHHQVRHQRHSRHAFEFLRNDKLDASNFFETRLLPDPTARRHSRIAAQPVWLRHRRAVLEEQAFLVHGLSGHASR